MIALDRTVALKRGERIHHVLPLNYSAEDIDCFAEDSRVYETFDAVLKNIGTARVSSDSVIYVRWRLAAETVVTGRQVPYYRFKHLVRELLAAKGVSLDKGKRYLLVTDAWSAGHFHWFMEVLPKILVIESRASEFVLMLPDTPYVRSVGLDSLSVLGIEFADIVWMRDDEFYKVPDLYYLTRIAAPGQVNDDLMKELNRRFRGDNPVGTKRYYVSRSDARIRKVLNESELEAVLSEFGFETVRPENFSLSDQVNLFKECQSLIGIHGAGLTNCIFMPPDGNVVELRKREPNYGYWHLADSVGHNYFYFHGVPDSDLSLIGHGCNLTIPIDEFRRTVLEPYF